MYMRKIADKVWTSQIAEEDQADDIYYFDANSHRDSSGNIWAWGSLFGDGTDYETADMGETVICKSTDNGQTWVESNTITGMFLPAGMWEDEETKAFAFTLPVESLLSGRVIA